MSRITTLALAGLTAAGMTAASLPAAQAAPFPAMNAAQVGGPDATVDQVGWRRGYYGPRYGYGYGRRNVGGALAAGAALGIIGGALAASAAPRYGYYGGYGYPAYGYYGGYGGYGGYGYPYGYGW